MKPNPIVLLIEDDQANRRHLRMLLESEHYRLFEAENVRFGLAAAGHQPDAIILGLALPGMGGMEVLERLRRSCHTPVLVLSESERESDAVAALDAGANGYMTRPFSEGELLARLRVLRRCLPSEFDEPMLVEGDLTVDLTKHLVTISGRKLDLTPTEAALFHTLVKYAGYVVGGKYLLRSVWGAEGESQGQYLRVFISNLRKKLEGTRGRVAIETTGGLGYRLLLRGRGEFTRMLNFA